jgi:lysophospholipase L1-like esterase
MSVPPNSRHLWLRRVFQCLVIVCWLIFFALLPHKSVSPEYLGRYSSEYMLFLGIILVGVIALTIPVFFRLRRPAFVGAMNIGGKLVLFSFSLGVTLLAVEGFVRAVDFLGVSMFEEVTRYVIELEADEELVYKQRADFDTVYQGVRFRTNELGLRDEPVPLPVEDELRVLVLGDSVTVGWGVSAEDRFSERLEKMLTDQLERPVHVINSGVSGYNTEQELIFLRRHIESMKPDLVIVAYVENDVEPKALDIVDMKQRWENPANANASLLRWSWFYRLIYYMTPDLLATSDAPPVEDGWRQSMESLAEMHRLTSRDQGEFVTYLYRMLADDLTNSLHAEISSVADSHKFRYVDTLPWFERDQFRALTNSFVDTHPNAEGNRVIAEGIARDLEESGMLCRLSGDQNGPFCSSVSTQ